MTNAARQVHYENLIHMREAQRKKEMFSGSYLARVFPELTFGHLREIDQLKDELRILGARGEDQLNSPEYNRKMRELQGLGMKLNLRITEELDNARAENEM